MNSPHRDRLAAFLHQGVAAGARPAQVAQAIGALCHGIDGALSPIVGARGVAALFGRCLHITGAGHPWLLQPPEGCAAVVDAATLNAVLASRSSADAAAAGLLFLKNFDALLTSLIGPSLTERLLQPVWATSLNGPAVQDISS